MSAAAGDDRAGASPDLAGASADPPGASPDLAAAVVRFAGLLRHLGVPVSTAEVLDALAALPGVDVLDRAQFRAALAATLVKGTAALATFDAAFQAFFADPGERRQRMQEQRARADAAMHRQKTGREAAERDLTFQGRPLDLTAAQKDAYSAMDAPDRARLRDFLERSSTGVKVDATLMPLVQNIVRGHLDRQRRLLQEELEGTRKAVALPLAPTGDPEYDALIASVADRLRESPEQTLLTLDIGRIPESEQVHAQRLVRQLARRLATRISRRYRRTRRRKHIDLRRTARGSIRYGGAPFRLAYRWRAVRRPRMLLICDVSGSMARYSRFVLEFAYGLARVVSGIESFVFSEDLERVTPFFQQRRDFAETMGDVVRSSVQWGRGTNLSATLRTFMARNRGVLTPHTVVVIVSDTKTLAAADAAAQLRAIRGRVREVLWLCTLPRAQWDETPTVAMFARYSLMHECNTLGHLDRIMRRHLQPATAAARG